MQKISPRYLNAASETLFLIHQLLKYLEKKGKRRDLVNFLSQFVMQICELLPI